MTFEADETKIPMMAVSANDNGIEIAWVQDEECLVLANLEKSGAFNVNVAKLAIQFMVELMNAHACVEPETEVF